MLQLWQLKNRIDSENREMPLYRQLEEGLKDLIYNEILKEGEMLPSSRVMAQELGVSRKTVITALEHLCFSSWLVNKERVGMFVAPRHLHAQSEPVDKNSYINKPKWLHDSVEKYHDFTKLMVDDGFPDSQLAPFQEFARAYRNFFNRDAKWKLLGYSCPVGYVKLREKISQRLNHNWGMQTSKDDICITRGSQMALFLIANGLLHHGDTVMMEDPGYEMAHITFARAGLNVVKIPVDEQGIRTDIMEEKLSSASAACSGPVKGSTSVNAIYVTPRHQYPTTVPMSEGRRKDIARLSEQYGFYVIEDDYGCDYEYSPTIFPTLSSILPKDKFLYIGSLSKILFPAIRVGYLAASHNIIEKIAFYRRMIDIQGDRVMEQTIYDLIDNGDIDRHIRRTTSRYSSRLDIFSTKVAEELGDLVEYHKPTGGLAIWLCIKKSCTKQEIQALLKKEDATIPTFTLPDGRVGLRIGYASMYAADVDNTVKVVKKVLTTTSPA